ncbi:protein phosphatase CheZ [Marinobacter salinisoli]|uniref:Protein phosphatase CheZ n=1 Tax=Marinobacter salinisoli TaxID=2769486 RepID=A0ABX7MSH2_9GAMM|nr:protein phosphatase CheZ [Marinobacter salinisoli]QSP94385.1 protein phosphatase CheZ [Marinobacter salinisoli]
MSDTNKNHRSLEPDAAEQLKWQASELSRHLEAGDYAQAMSVINELSEVRDQSLYREVGRLTRSLHEAIRNFQIDPRSPQQREALSKMSDASDRLAYVVQMTSEAANRTMDLVEESMPLAGAASEEASALRQEWQRLGRREMKPDEFRALYGRMDRFLDGLTRDAGAVYSNLSDILLAQGFQDLTGQVIEKVTALVKEVEDQMLSLVVMASHVDQLTGTVHQIDAVEVSPEEGVGPQIRANERADVVSGQDDVDDLLSSLGF